MSWEEEIINLFCSVDNFCEEFEPEWHKHLLSSKKRNRKSKMSLSEIITIAIYFHQSGYRNFKKYYTVFVQGVLRPFFPSIVSYTRFVELMKGILFPLFCFLQSKTGENTGVSFIDSTKLAVCNIKRHHSNKTFKGVAGKGKSTMGWFFGFKLHIVINDKGELLAWKLTTGNVDDRNPVPELTEKLKGLLFGDKGYISTKLFQELYERSLKLITRLRSNMKNKLMNISEKILLKKRGLIESVNNQLKNISQIEHTRHRSVWNFLSNLMCGLASYTSRRDKPSLNLQRNEFELLATI